MLASEHPDRLEALLAESRVTGRPLHEIEREWTGTTHAELGAYLLGLWGLPLPVVDAVARHHAPSALQQETLDATGAVAVTEALAVELDADPPSCGAARPRRRAARRALPVGATSAAAAPSSPRSSRGPQG